MKKYISNFHYISHDLPGRSHAVQTLTACQAGANWIQYRCYSKTDEQMIDELHEVAAICDDWGATLILADHYHLLDKVDAHGVHIEDLSADYQFIREQITDVKTLGASATTFQEMERIAASSAVDYIGYGPYAKTLTKPNDFPLLGITGYRDILSRMSENGIHIPVVAVGGVTAEDVRPLLETGVHGVAVSGAIYTAEDPAEAIKEFRDQF